MGKDGRDEGIQFWELPMERLGRGKEQSCSESEEWPGAR